MKNLFISLSLLLVLIAFGTFVFIDTAGAQNDLVTDLLNLPAPPPPNPAFGGYRPTKTEDFYSKKHPPSDDAPIDELIDYWQNQSANYQELAYNIDPSPKVLDRLMDAIKEKPELLGSLINIFPENPDTAEFVKNTYKAALKEDEDGQYTESIETWLKYHTDRNLDELLSESREVKDADEYVTNQDELLALTSIDFSKAQPIVNRLYGDPTQPVSQTLARWALYRHALDTDSLGDIEKYRDELKAIVEDKQATPGMRDLALDALAQEKEWPGRDEWYISLLEDETLAELKVNGQTYTGLTTMMYFAPPEKYMEKMIALLKSGNQSARNAAIKNLALLISKDNPEVVQALLPWLENPKWANQTGEERMRLVEALQSLSMPDSVPGLIDILEEMREPPKSSTANSNTRPIDVLPPSGARETANVSISTEGIIYRASVLKALAKQGDGRAVPVLRRVLNTVEEYERSSVVEALLRSHGFSVAEEVDALEAVARSSAESQAGNMNSAGNSYLGSGSNALIANTYPIENAREPVSTLVYTSNTNSNAARPPRPVTAEEMKQLLGAQLMDNAEAEEDLVNGVINRIGVLERREPRTAAKLREMIQNWGGPAINTMMLRDLKNGKATINSIVKLLSLRKELLEKQSQDVYGARDGGPLAEGIATCILNNNSDYDSILEGDNIALKTAVLACARLIRADIPAGKAAGLLDSSNKTLALAADRYLEANDSAEARAAILARHPNEARILGATTYSMPGDEEAADSDFLTQLFNSVGTGYEYYSYYTFAKNDAPNGITESRLQKEVRENEDLLGVYAYANNFIRIYKDKTLFSWEENSARYYERPLTESEFDSFKDFLSANNVDTLPPFIIEPNEEEGPEDAELLMLGKQGGRRVYLHSPTKPPFFKDLETHFENMRRAPAKLHYWLEKDLPGAEILFTDDNLKAVTVWKNGADTRLLIQNDQQQERVEKELNEQYQKEVSSDDYDYEKGEELNAQRRLDRQYEAYSWRGFAAGSLLGPVAQPPAVEIIPPRDSFPVHASEPLWRTRSGGTEVRANSKGLYKISRGQFTKIGTGYYSEPFIVPGGRWALATKFTEGIRTVRVNLLTGKEFPVQIGTQPVARPTAFIPSLNRLLVASGYYGDTGSSPGTNWYLFDAETGTSQPVKGEFRALAQQGSRPLQPARGADEFWAAMPDEAANETVVGIYNIRTFSFRPLQKIPKISFSSMDMWVEETEGKIYLVYAGHLLALPLKK